MPRLAVGWDVLEASIQRMEALYREGHRIVVAFSGGKDSGAVLEVCVMAAERAGCLPVEVVFLDEEICFPGTTEYIARIMDRPEIHLHWFWMVRAQICQYNREQPYWFSFDPEIDPEDWVRSYPDCAKKLNTNSLKLQINTKLFPPPEGKNLYATLGIRAQESPGRKRAIHKSNGYTTKRNKISGACCAYPIYDWQTGDVWRGVKELGWDYNTAYNDMLRVNWPRQDMRVFPPTMSSLSVRLAPLMQLAWPRWYSRVCDRLPGMRTVAMFGRRACTPQRNVNETWEECFYRLCVNEAPEWIRDRAEKVIKGVLSSHHNHSPLPFPQISPCAKCLTGLGSWRAVCHQLYNGDPYANKISSFCKPIEPEFFRPGMGTWIGELEGT